MSARRSHEPTDLADLWSRLWRGDVHVPHPVQRKSQVQINSITKLFLPSKSYHMSSKTNTCLIGLDLSIHNPGIVIRIKQNLSNLPIYHFIYFPKSRKQCHSKVYLENRVYIHALEAKPPRKKFLYDIDWYQWIVQAMMDSIFFLLTKHHISPQSTHVVIEDYAFRVKKTSSLTKLCEFAALVKKCLRDNKYSFSLLSNSATKKHFGDYGHATKEQMWLAFVRKCPDFAGIFEEHFSWSYDDAKYNFIHRKPRKTTINDKKSWMDEDEDGFTDTLSSSDDEDSGSGSDSKQQQVPMVTANALEKSTVIRRAPTNKEKKKGMNIPHPIEDLDDAFALIATYMILECKRT